MRDSASKGRVQKIRTVKDKLVKDMKSEGLSEAELLFMVAMIRTVKVGRSNSTGPNTRAIQQMLDKNVQVYLV